MWIYPVDMKRANEFGQIFEEEKDKISNSESKRGYLDSELKDEDSEESKTLPDQTNARKRNIKA